MYKTIYFSSQTVFICKIRMRKQKCKIHLVPPLTSPVLISGAATCPASQIQISLLLSKTPRFDKVFSFKTSTKFRSGGCTLSYKMYVIPSSFLRVLYRKLSKTYYYYLPDYKSILNNLICVEYQQVFHKIKLVNLISYQYNTI